MTPITLTIHISKNEIYPKRIYAGTRGSFGLTKLNFELSPEWDGAACTVVFHPKRGKPISVAWAGIPIDVPYEIMQYSGISSFVFSGTVYTDGKAEGKRISLPGEIEVLYTLEDEGINTKGFTPELYLQILALIGNLGDLTTESKKNLVSAINEAAESGGEVIDEKAVIEIIKKYIDEKVTPADIGAASVEDLNEKLTGSIEEDGEPVMLVTEDDLNKAVAKLEDKIASGGGAQADFLAKEGEPGYILNRDKIQEKITDGRWEEIVPLTEFTPNYDSTLGLPFYNVSKISLATGHTYKIIFDGIEYIRETMEFNYNGVNLVAVGNTMLVGGEDSGEPFGVVYFKATGWISVVTLDMNPHTVQVFDGIFTPIPMQCVPESAFPYYIKATGSGTDDDPYVCNETVANVRNIMASGRDIHLKLWNNAGSAFAVYYLSHYGGDATLLILTFTNPHNYAGGGDALNTSIELMSTDGESFTCREL